MTDPRTFLNRLKWKTTTNEFQNMQQISIDCYLFVFDPCLTQEAQYDFICFMETLDLKTEMAILLMGAWLMKHGISFRLKFKWDRNLPVEYNLSKIRRPAYVHGVLLSNFKDICQYLPAQ